MVRGIKSGLPITEAFQIVGREIADPVGERVPPDHATRSASASRSSRRCGTRRKRVGMPEFKFLVVTLSVQRETGGNLAETLENLDKILRRRRQMRLKVKAMSSEARASAMIIGALPFLMIGVLSVADQRLHRDRCSPTISATCCSAARGASMSMGIVVMVKMVRFDI